MKFERKEIRSMEKNMGVMEEVWEGKRGEQEKERGRRRKEEEDERKGETKRG